MVPCVQEINHATSNGNGVGKTRKAGQVRHLFHCYVEKRQWHQPADDGGALPSTQVNEPDYIEKQEFR